jgi:hypothetical protein
LVASTCYAFRGRAHACPGHLIHAYARRGPGQSRAHRVVCAAARGWQSREGGPDDLHASAVDDAEGPGTTPESLATTGGAQCRTSSPSLDNHDSCSARTSLPLPGAAHRGRSCAKRSLAFLAGCKSLRRTVSPTTPPEWCACEGGANRTTRVKRTQGPTSTAGETARSKA